jgi:hypothetical protein
VAQAHFAVCESVVAQHGQRGHDALGTDGKGHDGLTDAFHVDQQAIRTGWVVRAQTHKELIKSSCNIG